MSHASIHIEAVESKILNDMRIPMGDTHDNDQHEIRGYVVRRSPIANALLDDFPLNTNPPEFMSER